MKVDEQNQLYQSILKCCLVKRGVYRAELIYVRTLKYLLSNRAYILSHFSVDGKDILIPGENARVRLTIFKQMVMKEGQAFTIREGHITVATGIITAIKPIVELPFNKLSKVEIVD